MTPSHLDRRLQARGSRPLPAARPTGRRSARSRRTPRSRSPRTAASRCRTGSPGQTPRRSSDRLAGRVPHVLGQPGALASRTTSLRNPFHHRSAGRRARSSAPRSARPRGRPSSAAGSSPAFVRQERRVVLLRIRHWNCPGWTCWNSTYPRAARSSRVPGTASWRGLPVVRQHVRDGWELGAQVHGRRRGVGFVRAAEHPHDQDDQEPGDPADDPGDEQRLADDVQLRVVDELDANRDQTVASDIGANAHPPGAKTQRMYAQPNSPG